jgi:ribonuclease VapC
MIVDASAIVAIMMNEPDRDELLDKMGAARGLETTAVSAFEAVTAVGRKTGDRTGAVALVRQFFDLAGITIVPIEGGLLEPLIDAHGAYGKGTGHPAQLNMGDCFSYAMAKSLGVTLLYKGDDFAHTDLA